jgi:hypothetical protein
MTENPQAFPSGDKAAFPTATYEPGMTLRDWFAGQALAGLLADSDMASTPTGFAEGAYQYADAMLAERARARGEAQ